MDKPAIQQWRGEPPMEEDALFRDGVAQHPAAYRLLIEMSSDLLACYTPEGRWLYVSPVCQTLLGYEPADLVGCSLQDFLHPHDSAAVMQALAGMFTEPFAALRIAYRIRHKNGRYIWLETLGRIANGSKEPPKLAIYTSSRDVTAHKEAEADYKKLTRKLQAAIEETNPLSGVIAICSHCKRIRDDTGRWEQLEAYFHKRTSTLFSHGICPECARETFREFTEELGLDL